MGNLLQDLRYGARMLLKDPIVSLVVALSIGFGVGANTMVYTWMESLILNPYPAVEDADRLVGLNTLNQDGSASGAPPIAYLDAQDWRERAQSFEGLAVYRPTRLSLRAEAEVAGEPVWSEYVSGSYFDVLRVRPALGRAFLPNEEREAAPVVVISHAFWQRRFNAERAIIGRRVRQRFEPVTTLQVRTVNEPKLLAETLRREFTAINADLPFLDPRTLTEHISASSFVRFIGASMLSAFGLLALLMSSVGLYGVLAYIVSQRRREIATRLALGAQTRSVLGLVLRQGMRLIAIGLLIGLFAALAAGRLFGNQLPGISPNDPLTLVGVTLLLGLIALLACWIPARRATKVDPMIALRCE